MRFSRFTRLGAAAALVVSALVAGGASAQAAPEYTVRALNFKVTVGPTNSTTCDIVADLYVPTEASSSNRVPAILATNGFGGSKADQAGMGRAFASRGYVLLAYSGLGFGGSDCKITLDDPDFDGEAASQLISYLGGASGIAFTDDTHTTPAPTLDVVQQDTVDHLGNQSVNDPRVGMLGGSYGGQVQFAAASVDPRLDTIVPLITWNDLTYSLDPNNTTQTSGVSSATPGAAKLLWALGFTGVGVLGGIQNAPTDPSRLIGCPNFATFVCPALATAGLLGFLDPSAIGDLREASVVSYMDKITIPTLLIQGQTDTLFNLNEAIATYESLQAQGTPTKMIWFNGGHSGPAAPGELGFDTGHDDQLHVTNRINDWMDHYLKGAPTSTGPEFSYFRDWVDYDGIATPAYANSPVFPVGTARDFFLSGSELVPTPEAIDAGTQTFLTPVAGLPTSIDPLDALGGFLPVPLPLPEIDLPGTFASWATPALDQSVDVVGSPSVTLKVDAPAAALTQSLGPTGQLVLFLKIHDVDADGNATLVRNLIAPVRIPDVTKPFTVTMPAFVHRFATGHSIRLTVAGGSTNYRGGLVANPVSITTGDAGQVLSLPVVSPESSPPPVTDPAPVPEPSPPVDESDDQQPNDATTDVIRFAGDDRFATSAEISQETFEPGVDAVFVANGLFFADGLSAGPAAGLLNAPLLTIPGDRLPTTVSAELDRLDPQHIYVLGGSAVIDEDVVTALDEFAPGNVTRLSGANRYATAAAVSAFWPSADRVFVASGEMFADALSAGAAAARGSEPLLLTRKSTLPASTRDALQRLSPAEVTLVGGTGVVTQDIADAIQSALPDATVSRIAGDDRYETSAELLRQSIRGPLTRLMLASGVGFSDALAAAPASIALDSAFAISRPTCLPSSVDSEVGSGTVEQYFLIGGQAVLSDAVLDTVCPG